MLEMDGVEITAKRVVEIIEGDELADAFKLKEKVVKQLKSNVSDNKVDAPSGRREVLEQFIVKHWDIVKDNEVVKTALLNAYCMGRYKKDKREEMVNHLVSLAEGGTTVATVPAPAPEATKEETPDAELKAKEPADHREYRF
jgi:hypothetical protein